MQAYTPLACGLLAPRGFESTCMNSISDPGAIAIRILLSAIHISKYVPIDHCRRHFIHTSDRTGAYLVYIVRPWQAQAVSSD